MGDHGERTRRALTAHDRVLLKKLVDAELRRRHKRELDRTAAVKRRYFEALEARKRAYLPA